MNHDRVKLFTEKLDNLTISDYYGLTSPGLTCYLNSVLQVLFMTEDFRGSIKRCRTNGSTTIDTLLGKLFKDLERGLARTHRFITNLGITDVYKQRDAAEYFERILCLTSLEASKIFKGKLVHKTTCVRCKKTNDSSDFFWILPLVIESSPRHTYSVETGLKAFFNEDHVQGDDKMFCDQCNEKQDAFIECELAQTPVILTLLLKRFTFDHEGRSYVKLHCEVDVPQSLHTGNCKYDLYAIVNHYGNISGGHYTAQIRSFETGEWYCFNDDTVQRVRRPLFGSGNSVRSRTAYLVMYRKESTYSETSHEVDQEAEGRRDEAKTGEALPPPLHQLTDESYGGGENFNLLNGDAFKSSEMFWMKLTDSSTEAEKQLNTKELNRKQLNTNCQKNRLQMEPAWDRTGQDRDPTRDRVKPAGMNGVRTEREAVTEEDRGRSVKHRAKTDVSVNAADSVVQSFHCSSSPDHLTDHSHGSFRVTQHSLCRDSSSWRTTTNSKSREETVKREPWR